MLTHFLFWKTLKTVSFTPFENKIKFLLEQYGTRLYCNRFDVGNSIEYILSDYIRAAGFVVEGTPNAPRTDLCVNKTYYLSVKYSSLGNITLHNSNGHVNKDMNVKSLLVLTPTKIYLIAPILLDNYGIDVSTFTKNYGDSLKLKRTLLKTLSNINYPYMMDINITIDKSIVHHKLCSLVFYEKFSIDYEKFCEDCEKMK